MNMAVKKDEIRAIIGPNGAGKSTIFNLLTGFFPATSGKILYKDMDITKTPAYGRVKMGFSRSFQTPKIFPELTVRQNVYLAVQAYHSSSFELNIFKFNSLDLPGKTEDLLRMFDLARHGDQLAGSLSHGDQRILEICMAMALDPEVLLLDEPTSGMSENETQKTIDLLMRIYDEDPITMVIIEHDMRIVKRISHHITVHAPRGAPGGRDVRGDRGERAGPEGVLRGGAVMPISSASRTSTASTAGATSSSTSAST